MVALPLEFLCSPVQPCAILFEEMFEQDRTNIFPSDNAVVLDDCGEFYVTAAPLTPNQIFGGSPAKSRTATRRPKRVSSLRRRQLSVLVVDDVPDVTEMIALFLKHVG